MYKLEVTLVKGHVKIRGNKKVDAEAKKAANGKASKVCNLPKYLSKNLLPLSAAAVKQEYERKLQKKMEEKMGRLSEIPKTQQDRPDDAIQQIRPCYRGRCAETRPASSLNSELGIYHWTSIYTKS
jgi:hypothetical protein